jgi:ribosome-interacting GTPase 1
MKNSIEDLRNHLFETLEALKDKDNPMEVERARTIAAVAKEITDTARVEVEYAKVTGAELDSKFLQIDKPGGAPASPRPLQLPMGSRR